MQSRFFRDWTFLKIFFFISACSLAGCKSDAEKTADQPVSDTASPAKNLQDQSKTVVEGFVVKGTVVNGIVTAYAVTEHAGYAHASEQPLSPSQRTGADGSYRLELNENPRNGLVIRLTTDQKSAMKCDVVSGCKAGDGSTVAFGSMMPLPSDFVLNAATAINDSKRISIHVTPLTHLAYAWAEHQTQGLTITNITAGREKVADVLELPKNALDLPPIDISRTDWTTQANLAQLQAALISASFLSLATAPQWQSLSDVVDNAARIFASSSELPAVNFGGLPAVTQSDLLFAAADIAKDMESIAEQASVTSNPANRSAFTTLAPSYKPLWQSQLTSHFALLPFGSLDKLKASLVTLSQHFRSKAEALLEERYDRIPVQITFNPSSVKIGKNEVTTLNVNATGTEPLHYQWRKNGAVIPGATTEQLTLTATDAHIEGEYDCVVSNLDGSVTSLPAKVTLLQEDLILRWTMPSSRTDGSALAPYELKGYKLIYGTKPDRLDHVVQIEDPLKTEFSFSGLPAPATYYFAIAAIDHEGNESSFSPIVDANL